MIGLIGFGAGVFGAWATMAYGGMIGLNDIPDSRSSHSKVTPKGGGLGILLAFVCTSVYLSLPLHFWIPGLILSLFSFWGDRQEIKPQKRLFIQFCCAFVFLWGEFFKGGGTPFLLIIPMAIFITGTSNVYNFMDGIDGIAGMTGAAAFMLIWVCHNQNDAYRALCVPMFLACAGFLIFNIPIARVFMGDVGSVLLGFIFSCLMICLPSTFKEFVVMTGFLAPFYLDEMYTMVVRIGRKESLFTPHRRHVYQIVANELGVAHWKVSLVYVMVQVGIGFMLISLAGTARITILLAVYTIFSLIFWGASLYVRKLAEEQ